MYFLFVFLLISACTMKSVDVSSEEIKNVQAAKPKWHKTVAQKKCENLRLKMARLPDLLSWGKYCSYLPRTVRRRRMALVLCARCAAWIISTNLVLNIEKSLSIWLYVFQLFVIASQQHHCCFNKLNEIVIRLESRCSASDRISHRCRAITSNLSYFCLNVSNA